MSVHTQTIIEEENEEDNNSLVAHHHRDAHLGSNALYTSSVVLNLRQLQTDLQTQHHHEKVALTELNQRFHLFVDRIQYLQSQNAKYLKEIVNIQRHSSGLSSTDAQWGEHHHSQQSELATVCNAKVDCESDFDLFQLHIGIYQQLIDVEQHWKDKRNLKLEQELKHSASDLHTLRTSCAELEREIESLHAERTDVYKQYLAVTHDWCHVKKQRKKWHLNVDTLKSYVIFYKNLRSYTVR
jgi:chromosome segregation ATPase